MTEGRIQETTNHLPTFDTDQLLTHKAGLLLSCMDSLQLYPLVVKRLWGTAGSGHTTCYQIHSCISALLASSELNHAPHCDLVIMFAQQAVTDCVDEPTQHLPLKNKVLVFRQHLPVKKIPINPQATKMGVKTEPHQSRGS